MHFLNQLLQPHAILIVWGCLGIVVARLCYLDRRWCFVLLAPLVALIFWRGMPQDAGPNEGLRDLSVIAVGGGMTLGCALVGWFIHRRLTSLRLPLLSALVAAIGATLLAVGYERFQPQGTACQTTGMSVAVAGQRLYLPLDIAARLQLIEVEGEKEILLYHNTLESVPDVDQLCALSNFGEVPLNVEGVWMALHNRPTSIKDNCALSSHPFCSGFPNAMVGLVTGFKILRSPEQALQRAQVQFVPPPNGADSSETPLSISTTRDGTSSFCAKRSDEVLISTCTAWRRIHDGPILLAKGQKSDENPEAAFVTHDALVTALDWLESKLEPLAQ